MGGADWARTKTRVSEKLAAIAEGLVELYAEREIARGHAFGPDTPWQAELEESFPYEATPDQAKAIDETKADMENPKPMDRLVCGDVGYGKTEVAVRAIFKAVADKKQVAVLVPDDAPRRPSTTARSPRDSRRSRCASKSSRASRARKKRRRSSTISPPAKSTSWSERTASCRKTWSSATSA